jgi:hypothetical protein
VSLKLSDLAIAFFAHESKSTPISAVSCSEGPINCASSLWIETDPLPVSLCRGFKLTHYRAMRPFESVHRFKIAIIVNESEGIS